MQCEAVAASSGNRCRRNAASGDRFCGHHRKATEQDKATRPRRPREASRGDQETLKGIGDEIAMLRRQIRKCFADGDKEGVRKGVDTLSKAMRVQLAFEGRSADNLSSALAKALEEIGAELGLPL